MLLERSDDYTVTGFLNVSYLQLPLPQQKARGYLIDIDRI